MTEITTTLNDLAAGIPAALALLTPYWEGVKDFANSGFTASLAGAFAGAWAAQRIAERVKLREELQKEIRDINAGIVLALTTANLAMALKKQHVRALKKDHDSDCKKHKEYVKKVADGLALSPLELAPNLLSLQVLSPPVAPLQEIVFNRISTAGRAVSVVTTVADAIENLNHAITKRNELIEKIKEDNLPKGATAIGMYLGLPYGDGQINQEFGTSVGAIALYTDDLIFFSLKLSEDLREHGLLVAGKHKKKLGGDTPAISQIDLTIAIRDDLVPKDEDYEKWSCGFQVAPVKKLAWWQRPNKVA